MSGDQLLAALVAQGLLTDVSSQKYKRESLLANKPVEEVLSAAHAVDEAKMAEAKSAILKVPYYKVDLAAFDDAILPLVPEDTARTYLTVPLTKKDDLLVVGMVNPDDSKAQEALKFVARRARLNLGIYLISYADWQTIVRKYSPYKTEVEAAVKSLNIKSGAGQKVVELEGGNVGGEDAPVIRIVADTLRQAVEEGASDVHFEPQQNYFRIRFRVGGDLKEAASLPIELAQPVVSRVKVMSNLRIDETRIPQDGRFRSKILDREIDFRVATFPTPSGEKVAVRVLDPQTGLRTLDKLGIVGHNLEVVRRGLARPYGMVLISGPTGSGKSTTLYAILQTLNGESVNIVSLEDPVEYFVSGINQSQVRPEIGYDFASGLRQILRQDPDIIMVGEIRDNETAGLAIHAALTGHIVLSTIHTNNAVGIIPRLIDMKVEPFLLPSAVALLLSQRLVSQLCDNCKKPEPASVPLQAIIKDALAEMPKEMTKEFSAPYQIYHALGCEVCKGKGVTGRVALYEVFEMSPALEEVIISNPTSQKISAQAKKDGFISMREDGILKALQGIVLIEEVLRETE